MSNVLFISDLHLGHKKILHYSPDREGSTVEEHDAILKDKYCTKVRKRDKVFFCGDIAMELEKLRDIANWPGQKILIRGNHDVFPLEEYCRVFHEIYGIFSYKRFWISHCPIHQDEMRNRIGNIHGHCHQHLINDDRYVNVCVEHNNGIPVSLHEIRERFYL